MNRTAILGLLALVLLVAVGGWLAQRFFPDYQASGQAVGPAPQRASTEVDVATVEEAAVESCMCRRKGGKEADCEAIYSGARDTLLKEIYGRSDVEGSGGNATACAPVSSESECFEFTDGTKCIDTGFYVSGASDARPIREVCTVEEAQAIEAAERRGSLGPNDKEPNPNDQTEWSSANKRANSAVDETLRRILAGETIPPTKLANGCVG